VPFVWSSCTVDEGLSSQVTNTRKELPGELNTVVNVTNRVTILTVLTAGVTFLTVSDPREFYPPNYGTGSLIEGIEVLFSSLVVVSVVEVGTYTPGGSD